MPLLEIAPVDNLPGFSFGFSEKVNNLRLS
jgi:hypothetical protein